MNMVEISWNHFI